MIKIKLVNVIWLWLSHIVIEWKKIIWFLQKLTKKGGGGDIGLCDESRIYGCLTETWVFNHQMKQFEENYW